MACVSSFFPHAPPPPAPKPAAEPIVANPAAAPIRSAPPAAERGTTAVGLQFPAARSLLWDRTPQGAPQTLRAPTVQLVLAPHVLDYLCAKARGVAVPMVLGPLNAEAAGEGAQSIATARALPPLVLTVSSCEAPGSRAQSQACTIAVRVEPWSEGGGPSLSEAVYAELVTSSAAGFGGALWPRSSLTLTLTLPSEPCWTRPRRP
jgi:hypothetical protein